MAVTQENIGLLNDKLTVSITKSDYLQNLENDIFCKKGNFFNRINNQHYHPSAMSHGPLNVFLYLCICCSHSGQIIHTNIIRN